MNKPNAQPAAKDSDPRYSHRQINMAVMQCCTCGGGGPDDKHTCPACHVYHVIATIPNSAWLGGALPWTEEKPKRPGWWWWEARHTTPGGRIITSRGIDEVYFWGGRKQLWVNHGNSSLALKNHPAGRWAGPLPEPLEPSLEAAPPTEKAEARSEPVVAKTPTK